jgi:hypothetical protein
VPLGAAVLTTVESSTNSLHTRGGPPILIVTGPPHKPNLLGWGPRDAVAAIYC